MLWRRARSAYGGTRSRPLDDSSGAKDWRILVASGSSPIDSRPPSIEEPGGSPFQRRVQWIFNGPNGIRAGWRMLIAVALFAGFMYVIQAGLRHVPPVNAFVRAQSKD